MKHKIYIIIFSIVFSLLIWGSVTLSDQFYSNRDYDVKVINQPSGYTCGVFNPEKITLKLRAKGWQLLTIALGSQNEYLISADNDSGLITVDPMKEIDENNWLAAGVSVSEISPREISVIVEKIKFKKLKIEAESDISFSDGYGLASPIKVYPDSVLVSGPSSIINEISTIKTKPVKFSSADKKVKLITEIMEPKGFSLEQSKVELTFDIQRIVQNTFKNIKVSINGLPNDRNVVLIPNYIDCNLRGGINILGKINPNEIIATIDYRDIVYDTLGSVQPNILIPQNTELVFSKPARLNYVIKKFE
ncbi:MAG: CdaR family protein [Ignavibacterium sp.]|nr:CdaR family protein [Ignavibacterium sp.]